MKNGKGTSTLERLLRLFFQTAWFRLSSLRGTKLLLHALWFLMLPVVAQAQFTHTTANGEVTITSYTGFGGDVTIPSTINGLPVTSIGPMVFYYETSLTSVVIPDSVTSIGNLAFHNCTGLTSIAIPDSVTTIGAGALAHCTGLTSVTIGKGVTSIGYRAFENCFALTSVTIPESVTSIGIYAFSGCSGLTNITVDEANPAYSSVGGVLFSKSETELIAFPGGKARNYTIGNSVTTLGPAAFHSCTSLTNVTIGNSVTNMGSEAFSYCTGLTSFTIPNSVTDTGDNAFAYCSSLTSVTIPKSVTNIGSNAFYYCTNLASIVIPESVTSIGFYAFYFCSRLTGVYFNGNAPSLGNISFGHADNVTVYYLPGTAGWATTYGFRPTVLWNPQVPTDDPSFGVQVNQFGFTITGTSGLVIVVEAATDVANPSWSQVSTNTLTGGSSYFSDPNWANHPGRFYRLRSP